MWAGAMPSPTKNPNARLKSASAALGLRKTGDWVPLLMPSIVKLVDVPRPGHTFFRTSSVLTYGFRKPAHA
jgi:hypothetical protein